ncbi:MAG: pyridoxamine 5'-phosphate oxidase family protein [Pseudomonadota bacterium]
MQELVITSVSRPKPHTYFAEPELGFLNWDTLLWRFAAEKSYWLATADGAPHTMPVWDIWQDCAFRFSTDPTSKKARNLRQQPRASVHLANTEAVMVMECTARELTEARELQSFLDDYNPKYKWQFTLDDVRQGVFALTPFKAFAWSAGEGEQFHNTGTRWTFSLS